MWLNCPYVPKFIEHFEAFFLKKMFFLELFLEIVSCQNDLDFEDTSESKSYYS